MKIHLFKASLICRLKEAFAQAKGAPESVRILFEARVDSPGAVFFARAVASALSEGVFRSGYSAKQPLVVVDFFVTSVRKAHECEYVTSAVSFLEERATIQVRLTSVCTRGGLPKHGSRRKNEFILRFAQKGKDDWAADLQAILSQSGITPALRLRARLWKDFHTFLFTAGLGTCVAVVLKCLVDGETAALLPALRKISVDLPKADHKNNRALQRMRKFIVGGETKAAPQPAIEQLQEYFQRFSLDFSVTYTERLQSKPFVLPTSHLALFAKYEGATAAAAAAEAASTQAKAVCPGEGRLFLVVATIASVI